MDIQQTAKAIEAGIDKRAAFQAAIATGRADFIRKSGAYFAGVMDTHLPMSQKGLSEAAQQGEQLGHGFIEGLKRHFPQAADAIDKTLAENPQALLDGFGQYIEREYANQFRRQGEAYAKSLSDRANTMSVDDRINMAAAIGEMAPTTKHEPLPLTSAAGAAQEIARRETSMAEAEALALGKRGKKDGRWKP